MATAGEPGFESLTPVVLSHIFSFLSLEDRTRARVCRNWCDAGNRSLALVRRIRTYLGNESYDRSMGLEEWRPQDYCLLSADPYRLEILLSLCKNVTQLAVDQMRPQYGIKQLRVLVKNISDKLPHLKFLIWNDDRMRIPFNEKWELKHLSCNKVTASELRLLLTKGLVSLNVDETDFREWNILPTGFQQLIVKNSAIDYQMLGQSEGIKSLTRLQSGNAPDSFPLDVLMPDLKRLSIAHNESFELDSVSAKALDTFLASAPNLTSFKLVIDCPSIIPDVNMEEEPAFYNHLRNIRHLHIETNVQTAAGLSDLQLHPLILMTPNVQHLTLVLSNIADGELQTLTWTPGLKNLSITLTDGKQMMVESLVKFVETLLERQGNCIQRIDIRGFELMFRPKDQRRLLRLIPALNSHMRYYIELQEFEEKKKRLLQALQVDRFVKRILVKSAAENNNNNKSIA